MIVPHPDQPFRLGTRASPLAVRQADMARAALIDAHGFDPAAVVLVPMVASGDRILDRALADVGGKALWTRELDGALAGGRIDAAVHSMKDVETLRPPGFAIAAMLPRADVRDRLVGAPSVAALPPGARIGTASPRRTAQLLGIRADLCPVLLRGNVGTRLQKIADGAADATLLAAAGLDRLGMHDVGHAIAVELMLPAPQQGAIGIEVRAGDAAAQALVASVNDAPTMRAVLCERAFLAALGGDCQSPVAALARINATGVLTLAAQIFSADGAAMRGANAAGAVGDDPSADATLAASLARDLLAQSPPAIRRLFGR